MAYGTLKVDSITFTNGDADQTITVSGIVQSISGDITATGTIQAATIIGTSTVSGATVTGDSGQYGNLNIVSGVFTTQISGATITGDIGQYTTLTGISGVFTTAISGATITGDAGNYSELTAISGVFTTQVSGATVTGDAGSFTTVTGGVATITSGVFALGEEALPSISFSSDPDTGIYSPGADQLALSTNGAGRLFVDASGRIIVGAATAAIGIPLEIVGNAPGLAVGVRGRSADNIGVIGFYPNNASTEYARIQSNGDSSLSIGTGSSGSERLRITSTGELKHLGGGTEGSPAVYFAGSAPSNSLYVEATTGNVGIGASSPGAKLDVWPASSEAAFRGNSGVSSQVPAFEFRGYNTNGTNGGLDIRTNLNGTFTDRVRITNDGLVGIGTTNVDELLHVESDGATPKIKVESTLADSSPGFRVTNDARSYDIRIDGTNDNLQFYDATASEGRVAIDSSGRLLVGTASSPSTGQGSASNFVIQGFNANPTSLGLLSIQRGQAATSITGGSNIGRISFNDSNGNSFGWIQMDADADAGSGDYPGRLVFSVTQDGGSSPTTSPSAMTINSGQEVLIGYSTDNGAYKLQVNSQIFATSATIATSDGRYKENVATLDGCVDLVKALRPVSFDWKAQEPVTRVDEDGETVVVREAHNFPDGKQVGFIAQEVEEVLADKPWLGSVIKQNVRPAVTDADGNELAPEEEFLGIAEGNLVAVLTSALKDAITKIETLEQRLNDAGIN